MKLHILLIRFSVCLLLFNNAFSQSPIEWEKNTIHDNYGKSAPMSVCVGDIDGDGFPDIVTADYWGGGISWIKNINGNGNFGNSKFVANLPAIGNAVYGITDVFIADIDGDGFNDVVYVNTLAYWVRNLDGNGNFGEPITLSTTTFRTFGLQVIDIDNDGDLDIVHCRLTSSPSYRIEVFRNNGDGTFAPPELIKTSSVVQRFTLTDISGDNLPDLVYETQSAVSYYQQNSDGTFPSTATEYMGSTSNHMSSGILNMGNIKGGDIDGDGDIDIVNIYQNGSARSIRWFRNDNNVFANSQTLINIPSDNGSSSNDYFTLRLADLDNDGKIDIITQNSFTNSITWYKNLGEATFDSAQVISDSVMNNKDVFIADINGDNNLDVVTADFTNSLIKWFDNTDGDALSFEEHTIDGYISMAYLSDIGDIDGDGIRDALISSSNTEKLVWLRNTDGFGSFSETPNHIITSLGMIDSALLVDFNDDGHKDIVASSNTQWNDTTPKKIVWLTNDGQGNFSNEQSVNISERSLLFTADVNNDGKEDVIAYYSHGNQSSETSINVLINNGNGFDLPVAFNYTTKNIQSIEAVDMDYDGDLDLLVYFETNTPTHPKGLYWIENTNGLGDFSVIHPTNLQLISSKHFATGDFDEDGLTDIIYIHKPQQSSIQKIRMVSINTDGTLSTPVDLVQSSQFIITHGTFGLLKIVDFDNDGDFDILSEYKLGIGNNNLFFWLENLGNNSFTYHLIQEFIPQVGALNFIEDMNADGKPDFVTTYPSKDEIVWYQNLGLSLNQIKGNVSLDVALNECNQDSIVAQQVLITLADGNSSVSTFTASNGNYSFKVEAGNYSTSITSTFPYFTPSPNTISNQFDNNNEDAIANFCLIPSQFFDDLEVSFYPLNDARPGFEAKYQIVVKNKGTNPVSTTVEMQYNHQKINFIEAAPNPLSQTSNTLVFNIENLQPFATYKTTLSFQVNTIPVVTLGETIVFYIENNLQDDISPNNNSLQYNQTIVGSYDPNDMLVLEGEEVHIDNSSDYLHYIIRFQNTGNYFAERVLITTILDEKLDWETIEIESFSHSNRVEIIDGSIVNFIFDAIYLPAVTANEEGSNGFVAFKIKPKSTVVVDDTISAEAGIYFDYNPPIITNEVTTTFVSFLNVSEPELNPITIYPNPVSSLLYIKNIDGNYKVEIYNTLGLLISTVENNSILDFTNLTTGIYIVRITNESGKAQVVKVIKK